MTEQEIREPNPSEDGALNSLSEIQDQNLKGIVDQIKELSDGVDDNDKMEISGLLTQEFANFLKENSDIANKLYGIVENLEQYGNQTEDFKKAIKDMKAFVEPYKTENKISNIQSDGITNLKANFVNNIDNRASETQENITKQISDLGEDYDNNLKESLSNILKIIQHPNEDNTRKLQQFLFDNIIDGQKKAEFKKQNFKGDTPDGKFGKYTLDGLNDFLEQTADYINKLKASKTVQKEHDDFHDQIVQREQERIDNLKINAVMGPISQYNNERIQIQTLIESITDIESWDESESNITALSNELMQKEQNASELQNKLDHWDEEKKKTKVFLGEDEDGYTKEDRARIKKLFSDDAKRQTEDDLARLNGEIARINDILAGNKNEKITEKLGQLEEEYKIMIKGFNNSIKGRQKEINDIPLFLKGETSYKNKINGLTQKITDKQKDINKILEFFGWETNGEGEIINNENNDGNNDYKDYKSKYLEDNSINQQDSTPVIENTDKNQDSIGGQDETSVNENADIQNTQIDARIQKNLTEKPVEGDSKDYNFKKSLGLNYYDNLYIRGEHDGIYYKDNNNNAIIYIPKDGCYIQKLSEFGDNNSENWETCLPTNCEYFRDKLNGIFNEAMTEFYGPNENNFSIQPVGNEWYISSYDKTTGILPSTLSSGWVFENTDFGGNGLKENFKLLNLINYIKSEEYRGTFEYKNDRLYLNNEPLDNVRNFDNESNHYKKLDEKQQKTLIKWLNENLGS